jgi:hypothetical protein
MQQDQAHSSQAGHTLADWALPLDLKRELRRSRELDQQRRRLYLVLQHEEEDFSETLAALEGEDIAAGLTLHTEALAHPAKGGETARPDGRGGLGPERCVLPYALRG